MVGRTVLHYQLLEKLGAGGMGEIFKAQDTRLNRYVAVKVLSATGGGGDVERRKRFTQEAQAAFGALYTCVRTPCPRLRTALCASCCPAGQR